MTVLRMTWVPADYATAILAQNRRGGLIGASELMLLARGLVLAVAVVAAPRIALWAVMNPRDPSPLLAPLATFELVTAGCVLGAALALALVLRLAMPFLLRSLFQRRGVEGREPLIGPVEIVLTPERLSSQGPGWSAAMDTALLTRLEERPAILLAWFGPGRVVPLPRREMSEAEVVAVRDWAAAALRGRQGAV